MFYSFSILEACLVIGAAFIPFGIWKVVELIIWVCQHVHIGVS